MTPNLDPRNRSIIPVFMGFLALVCSGCSALNVPELEFPRTPFVKPKIDRYPGAEAGFAEHPEAAEQIYKGVREAKARNAVVLHVVGDSSPVRVLPLPEDGRSVTVSNLLTQTQVTKKLGTISATLFRPAADSISGMPLAVKMEKDGRKVRPECDYALRPGDRLRVKKSVSPTVQGLIDGVFGL